MLYRGDFAGARDGELATAVDEYDSPGHTLYWATYTNQDPGVANRLPPGDVAVAPGIPGPVSQDQPADA